MTSIETQAGARSAGTPGATGFGHAWRLAAATGLQGASALLGRLAVQLAATPASRAPLRQPQLQAQPQVEFHAEVGAPEGALYVDGRLIGWVSGVTRL